LVYFPIFFYYPLPTFPLIVTFVPFDHYREKNILQSQLCMNLSPIFSHNRVTSSPLWTRYKGKSIDRMIATRDSIWSQVTYDRWRGAINRVRCETRGRKSEVGRVFLIRAMGFRSIPVQMYRWWPPRSKWHVIPRYSRTNAAQKTGMERHTWVKYSDNECAMRDLGLSNSLPWILHARKK